MDYTVITKEQARLIRGFVADDIYEGFAENNRFAVCATKENVLCGVGVFDAKTFMEIVDIVVLPQYTGKLEGKLLNIIMGAFAGLPCEAVKMDVYEGPETEALRKALVDNGFKESGKVSFTGSPWRICTIIPGLGTLRPRKGFTAFFKSLTG